MNVFQFYFRSNKKVDGLNSEIKFGHIVYRNQAKANEERISASFALKTKPTISLLEDFVIAQFFNEITFHVRALPFLQQQGDVQPLLAKFYDSFVRSSAQGTEFVLIFEDLKSQGFRMHERHSFLDVDHLLLMLNRLGRFHSYSYRAKGQDLKGFQALGRWFHDAQGELAHRWPNFMDSHGLRGLKPLRHDPRYSSQLATIEKYLQNSGDFIRQWNTSEQDQPMSVLCHGDYLRGNIMFRYENGRPVEQKMIDLATPRLASPAIDLGGVLYLNADQQTRNQHWDRLIDAYYEGLIEVFGRDEMPSRDSILNEFKVRALYAYFIASYFLPRVLGCDLGKPDFFELVPPEYASNREVDLPNNVYQKICEIWGGEETTEALADILRDMIDRGFI